ncbi:MAG: peptidoglycan-associated lipoprotein [Elusimicrobia bacterium]|nr:MAG: peptidoglycan-associated lipoprotein [Elusimicrobiota bacterium]KAF0157876.1 MAG: peptidoglycan-associated lipoprotein [Elusimicrobiota bacterium]
MNARLCNDMLRAMLVLAVAVSAAACGKKNVKQVDPPVQVSEADFPLPGGEEGEPESSLRGKAYAPDPELSPVRFSYDKSELGEEARRKLQANVAVLKKRPGLEIQIAGHCDERGTSEYNLALGQRRANAVRDYYRYLGVGMGRMSTISYGEEAPLCAETAEDCWSRNRRAETLARRK